MINLNTKINLYKIANVLLYIFAILPFIGIAGVPKLVGDDFVEIWKMAGLVLLFGRCIFNIKKISVDLFVVFFALYKLETVVVSIVAVGLNLGLIVASLVEILLVLLLFVDASKIIEALIIIFIPTVIVNFITVLFSENTDTDIFFIGGKNSLSLFMVPAIFILFLKEYKKKGKLNFFDYIFSIFCFATVLLGGSTTGLVVVVFGFIALFVLNRIRLNKWVLIALILFANIVLIFFNQFLIQSELWQAVTSFLGKDSTLTYRTDLWNLAIDKIKDSALFGIGRGSELYYDSIWNERYIVNEAHNFWLEIVFEGGFVALILYAVAFYAAIKNLDLRINIHRAIFTAILVLMVNGLAESINNKLLVILIIAMANYYGSTHKKSKTMSVGTSVQR